MNRTIALTALILLSAARIVGAEKKWVDKTVLKSIFTIAKKSSVKYEFKAVNVLPHRENGTTGRTTGTAAGVTDIRSLLKLGKTTAAGSRISKKLTEYPHDPDLFILKGELALLQKNGKEAGMAFRRAFLMDRSLAGDPGFLRKSGWKKNTLPTPASVPVLLQKTPTGSVGIYYIRNIRQLKTHFSWITYALSRAFWRFEGAWKKRFPDARWYRPSFEEDVFCYKVLVFTWEQTKKREDGLANSDLDRLLALDRAGLLEGYVFCHVYRAPIGTGNAYILSRYSKSINKYLDSLIRGE